MLICQTLISHSPSNDPPLLDRRLSLAFNVQSLLDKGVSPADFVPWLGDSFRNEVIPFLCILVVAHLRHFSLCLQRLLNETVLGLFLDGVVEAAIAVSAHFLPVIVFVFIGGGRWTVVALVRDQRFLGRLISVHIGAWDPSILGVVAEVGFVVIARRYGLRHELSLIHQLPCGCILGVCPQNFLFWSLSVVGRAFESLLSHHDVICETRTFSLAPLEALSVVLSCIVK